MMLLLLLKIKRGGIQSILRNLIYQVDKFALIIIAHLTAADGQIGTIAGMFVVEFTASSQGSD